MNKIDLDWYIETDSVSEFCVFFQMVRVVVLGRPFEKEGVRLLLPISLADMNGESLRK